MEQQMKLARNRESGQIFILVLILLALVPLLVIPMLRLSYSSQMYHQIVEINTLNVYAADSGIEYALYQIYNYPSEIQETPLSENLTINGIDVHVTAEYDLDMADFTITSTSTKAGRSQTIECVIVIDVGLFGNVIACDGNLTVMNCDFVNPEYPGESDVYTHGNITLKSSYIDGDAKASGTISLQASTVTGDIIEGAEVLTFPEIDVQIHLDRAQAGGNHTGDYNTSDQSLGPIYIDGNLNIGSGDDVELTGTVYVTGDVHMVYGNISGFGDIIAEGDIIFDNYTYLIDNPVTLPLIMTIGVDKSIDIENDIGDPGTMAILYAANGIIDLANLNLYGSVAAPLVQLNNAMIHYPAELRGRADLPGAGLDTVTYIFK
ncbi:hypothetical protein ACFLVC_04335 [Chloroflexota bacterium]